MTYAIDDITMLAVPKAAMEMGLADEQYLGMAWWEFHGQLFHSWRRGDIDTILPITYLALTLCKTIAEVNAIKLRHDCASCQDGIDRARKQILDGHYVVIVQFTHHDIHEEETR